MDDHSVLEDNKLAAAEARLKTMLNLVQVEFGTSPADIATIVMALLIDIDPGEVRERLIVFAGVLEGKIGITASGKPYRKVRRRQFGGVMGRSKASHHV
jgi:hypothetical protein